MVRRVSQEVQQVIQGSSVTLECRADGYPPAAISWSRQHGHLPSGAQSEEGLSITLGDVERHVEGIYICTASNGLGRPSSASMTIKVKYPPEIITEQAILHTGEGDEAKLVCIVHGRPTPTVTWTRGGHAINTDRHISSHDGLHRHALTVKHVKDDDFGDYTCTATSPLGRTNSSLRLTGKSSGVNAMLVYFQVRRVSQEVQQVIQGSSVTLECRADGYPPAAISWSRQHGHLPPGRPIRRGGVKVWSPQGLSITLGDVERHVEGIYICTASNGLGRPSSASMTIKVKYPPEIITEQGVYSVLAGLPRTPRLTSSPAGGKKSSYTLTWETESYTPVIMYRLQYRRLNDNRVSQATGPWDIKLHSTGSTPGPAVAPLSSGPVQYMSHAITHLEPATDYEATVAVENKFGWSSDSQIFHFYTRKEIESERFGELQVYMWRGVEDRRVDKVKWGGCG
ncbi:Hemicentin-2 [Chionoecetes opilio]|uniref:Hemicentin-2 n=1 Tax=Chionoecetes opilio TaxID=41210 RepID=A0A8J4YCF0_CHIOP|nr:Hemicentin-2 [Chionoecetes opilio]